jgi:putative ABC transport system permease protein
MIIAKFFQNLSSLLSLVIKRLWHNLGLSASALIGIISVLSLVVCVPVFSHAISADVLRQQLNEKVQTTHRRMFSLHSYFVDTGSVSVLSPDKIDAVTSFINIRMLQLLELPVERNVVEIQSGALDLVPVLDKGYDDPETPLASLRFLVLDTLPQYSDLVDGSWPETDTSGSGPIQVVVSQTLADQILLSVGETYHLGNVEIEITGMWQERNPEDPIWFNDPTSAYQDKVWVPYETFKSRLSGTLEKPIYYASWYTIVNESSLKFQNSPQYARGLMRLNTELTRLLPGISTDYSPLDSLTAYQQRAESLMTLFYAVGAPMIVLALLFITLTSRIAVQQYEQEIATLRGRGTSWLQVILMNLVESLILVILAVPLSLLGGLLAASLMGKTVSFLKFSSSLGYPLTLQGLNYQWLAIAVLLILVTRLLPMMGLRNSTIVRLKQEQSRSLKKPAWERFFLDFVLLILALYAYVTMRGWAKPAQILSQMQLSGEQFRDPLLFIAPALFSIAICMVMLRVVPLFVRLLAAVVDRLPGAWAYLSLQQIARRSQDYSSPLLLIMISLSLAIFSASTAKTLDQWLDDSVYYKTGADLAVRELLVRDTSVFRFDATQGGSSSSVTVSDVDAYSEGYTTIDDHLKLPSVLGATRVGKYKGTFSFGTGETSCLVMGIDRLDFPKVAFFRDDFASQSLGALMNGLGSDMMGVLVPSDVAKKLGLSTGDTLTIATTVLEVSYVRDYVVVGTYDYFPTVYPSDTSTLIVNLDSIFDNPDSVIGYHIWLKLRANTDIDVLTYQIKQMIGGENALINIIGNGFEDVKTGQNQPERKGLFGVLNVGFLITGLMPGIGFLLYSYASLRRRFIQLGILQAIGLSVKQLIGYLALEQFLLMGIAILSGAFAGLLTSVLYVPFLQTGAAPGSPIPPFQVHIGWVEAGWLSLAFSVVLILTMVGTIYYLVRLKVFQAVKMGEVL